MLQNYKFVVQYDGTKYSGWQKQGNTQNTIQGKLEQILLKMTGSAVEIHGSGRTDAGVHAKGQVGNFKCKTDMQPEEILQYINNYLPHDIKILSLVPCDMRFHSRLNATEKRYSYTFCVGKPDVFFGKYMYSIPAMPNRKALEQGIEKLCGTHDFLGFSSLKKAKKSTVRSIFDIRVQALENTLTLTFCGNGFLYNSVRILAGTLYEIGIGQKTPSDIERVFQTKDRAYAGAMLPACGLCLEEVLYR